ncbi:hypothetical protein PROFUN_07399 [Planoprotostelium fungivorum]|uniref:SH3 domain-containing protein n=1 Tax=Planoprotostelium fungivorum TaxID=1890364 RepID=A0A2P6MTL0_9EUKA|nr:hypothetical protein PROFUN_07399 [Planoprotostelium fungivorum]
MQKFSKAYSATKMQQSSTPENAPIASSSSDPLRGGSRPGRPGPKTRAVTTTSSNIARLAATFTQEPSEDDVANLPKGLLRQMGIRTASVSQRESGKRERAPIPSFAPDSPPTEAPYRPTPVSPQLSYASAAVRAVENEKKVKLSRVVCQLTLIQRLSVSLDGLAKMMGKPISKNQSHDQLSLLQSPHEAKRPSQNLSYKIPSPLLGRMTQSTRFSIDPSIPLPPPPTDDHRHDLHNVHRSPRENVWTNSTPNVADKERIKQLEERVEELLLEIDRLKGEKTNASTQTAGPAATREICTFHVELTITSEIEKQNDEESLLDAKIETLPSPVSTSTTMRSSTQSIVPSTTQPIVRSNTQSFARPTNQPNRPSTTQSTPQPATPSENPPKFQSTPANPPSTTPQATSGLTPYTSSFNKINRPSTTQPNLQSDRPKGRDSLKKSNTVIELIGRNEAMVQKYMDNNSKQGRAQENGAENSAPAKNNLRKTQEKLWPRQDVLVRSPQDSRNSEEIPVKIQAKVPTAAAQSVQPTKQAEKPATPPPTLYVSPKQHFSPPRGLHQSTSKEDKKEKDRKPLPVKKEDMGKSASAVQSERHEPESTHHNVKKSDPPKRAKVISRPTLLALYDYSKLNLDELDFCEGDLLFEKKKNNDGWCLARDLLGNEGMIPGNFVSNLTDVKRTGFYAKSSLKGEAEGDLDLTKHERVYVLNDEGDWWIAELEDGSIGYVPESYLTKEKP